jgi:pimeloyl-ACP methyl ester carboxylesterase
MVCHSMGGVIAQMVAEQIPVAGVIDIDGNVSLGDCTFSLQALEYTEAEFVSHGFALLREARYERGVDEPALRGHYAGMRAACPGVIYRNCRDLVELSRSETLAPRLAALATPTLFVAGTPGGICVRSHELLAEHGLRCESIAEAGHWPFIDQPAAFTNVVAGFLSE